MKDLRILIPLLLIAACTLAAADATIPTAKTNSAWWMGVHASITEDLETFSPDILFMGDSITDSWDAETIPSETNASGIVVWDNYYVPRQAYNAGIAGDKIENLLWRVRNGIFSNAIDPDVVVLMIGANNTDSETNMAAGLKLIVDEVLATTTNSQIIMLGTFPKQWSETHSDLYAAVDDWPPDPRLHVLNINDAFLDPDESRNETLYADNVHLNEAGYEVWQAEMEPLLSQLLGSDRDSDGDGLPDTWEMTHSTGVVHMAATGNPDGDAHNNLSEYIAGLDPAVSDAFKIEDMNIENGILTWTAATGRIYSVYWTPALTQPFVQLQSNLTAGVFTDTVHQADAEAFYRLKVEVAP